VAIFTSTNARIHDPGPGPLRGYKEVTLRLNVQVVSRRPHRADDDRKLPP